MAAALAVSEMTLARANAYLQVVDVEPGNVVETGMHEKSDAHGKHSWAAWSLAAAWRRLTAVTKCLTCV